MAKVLLRNVNPLGHVDLPLIGRQGPANDEEGSGCLIPGEVFEVDEALAGCAPHWRPVVDDDNPDMVALYESRTVGEGDDAVTEVYDPGYGLLAQVGNYEPVKRPKPLEELTPAQLKKLAKDRGVDLGAVTEKADIIAAIEKGV